MVNFSRSDFVTPAGSSAAALAVGERLKSAPAPFSPTVVGPFTHLTTSIETTISTAISSTMFTSATAMSSGDVVTACSTLVSQINENRLLLNRVIYILEANGMTS